MPSTTLQSRINAFESLAGPSSSPKNLPRNPAKYRPIDSLLETPLTPSAANLPVPLILPSTSPNNRSTSPSPSPPNLGRKTSLIDLKDWVVDDGPALRFSGTKQVKGSGESRTPTQHVSESRKNHSMNGAPLINLESPPKARAVSAPKAPPLPPRKPSFASLNSASSSASPSSPNPSLLSPRRAESLNIDHTYPPVNVDLKVRNGSGHVPASSVSSFHSVSLSSDTDPSTPNSVTNFASAFPKDHEYTPSTSNGSEGDSISLDESYENVSASSLSSPTAVDMISDWEKAMAKRKPMPPKLPQRPSAPSKPPSTKSPPPQPPLINAPRPLRPTSSASSSASSTTTRRPPPPPPPPSRSSASDRSSILSNATSHSTTSSSTRRAAAAKLSLQRPTPVPAFARNRYESVFTANIQQQRKAEREQTKQKPALLSPTAARKTRQAAGWRGLSVDLITAIPDHPVVNGDGVRSGSNGNAEDDEDLVTGNDERLDGHIVRIIWSRSKLDKGKLSAIWNECDPTSRGTLDRDAFVKGMWRIDEELRRAQIKANVSSSTAYRIRQMPMPKPKPKPILR